MQQIDARIRRRLKLRDLDTVLTVAQCGSMAKAANQLALSQPAVSKTISDLEFTLGVPLFDRTAQGVEPNRYGKALLKWTAAIFDDVRQGVTELRFLADPTAGELRIGAPPPILGGFLPAVLTRLSRQHPRLTFHVTETVTVEDQQRQIRERNVDLIVGRATQSLMDDHISVDTLFDEPWSIVAGVQNPLARRRKLKLADLSDEPWSLPPMDLQLASFIRSAFRKAGLDAPRAVVTCRSVEMHHALVTQGSFLALFPRSLLSFGTLRQSIKALPVKIPATPPPVAIITLKNRTPNPVTQIFIQCARDVAKQLDKT